MLSPLAKLLSNVNPNHLSLISLFLAIGAAFFYVLDWEHALLFAAALVLLSGAFEALDGKVARISSKASKRGDFVDHVIDRYSDAIILGAIAMSGLSPVSFGLFAVIGVLLASYMGTQAQALGLSREYRGMATICHRSQPKIYTRQAFHKIQRRSSWTYTCLYSRRHERVIGYSWICRRRNTWSMDCGQAVFHDDR